MVVALVVGIVQPVGASASPVHGTVFAWGSNAAGQLGSGTTGGSSATPSTVAGGLTGVTEVAAGGSHGVSLRTEGGAVGTVWTWGSNAEGQLGRQGAATTPARVTPLDAIVEVAAGEAHTVALAADGRVWTWGRNVNGQLGRLEGLGTSTATPGLVNSAGTPLSNIVGVAAGRNHTLAVAANGDVWAFGDNSSGQLGIRGVLVPSNPVPQQVFGVSGVSEAAAGRAHSIVRLTDGSVRVFGSNSSQQIAAERAAIEPLAVDIGLSGVEAVAAGAAFNLVLAADGTVRAWGANDGGQLGRGDVGGSSGQPAAVLTSSGVLAGVAGIAAGASHATARRSDGSVWTWGSGDAGRLGRGGAAAFASPADVVSTAIDTAGGQAHTLAAVAPRLDVAADAVDFGTIELGATTEKVVELTNAGPGPLFVSSVRLTDDTYYTITGDTCTPRVEEGQSCSLALRFAPTAWTDVPYESVLLVETNAFGEPSAGRAVSLTGRAVFTTGALDIVADANSVTASPPDVPLAHVALQADAPSLRTAPSGSDDISLAPGGLDGLELAPTGLDGIELAPVGLGDIELAPGGLDGIELAPVGLGDIELAPTGLDGIELAPLAADGLGTILLSSLPLRHPRSWSATVLADTPLADRPIQDLTIADVRADATARERFGALKLGHFDWSASPLRGLSPIGVALGPTRTAAISGWDVCADVEALGYAGCGAGLGRDGGDARQASILELQLSGVALKRLPPFTVADVDLDDGPAPVRDVKLASIASFLQASDLGAVPLSDAPHVVDCARTDCVDGDLARAATDGAILPDATVGDLGAAIADMSIAALIYGLIPNSDNPYGVVPIENMGILGYGGAGTSRVGYHLTFHATGTADVWSPTVKAVLPPSFTFDRGTTAVRIDGVDVTDYEESFAAVADGLEVTWRVAPDVPAGTTLEIDFLAAPGIVLGTHVVPSVSVSGENVEAIEILDRAPVKVTENFEPNGPDDAPTPVQPGRLYIAHVSSGSDQEVVTFDAPAGSRVSVFVDHLPVDVDAVLYYGTGSTSPDPLRPTTRRSRAVPVSDEGLTLTGAGEPLSSEVRDDIPLLPYAVAGIGHQRGTSSERIDAYAFDDGRFILQLVGYNTAFSERGFTFRVHVREPAPLPECCPHTFAHDDAPYAGADEASSVGQLPDSVPAGTPTIYLVNRDRLHDTYGEEAAASVMTALGQMASSEPGAGVVVPVDGDPAVRSAYQAWDAAPWEPDRANDVVRAINTLVDALSTPTHQGLQAIAIVGDGFQVPQAAIREFDQLANERGFSGELASTGANNFVRAAVHEGRILTDDPYAAFEPILLNGRELYVPDVALGRVIGTPDEIVAATHRFLEFDGRIAASTMLATGYGFMDDAAARIEEAFASHFGPDERSSLRGEGWTREDLLAELSSTPGIASLNGHADHTLLVPPAGTGAFTAADAAAQSVGFGRFWFTMACHAGLNVPDAIVASPLLDLPEAATAGKHATHAANTGFGMGLSQGLGLSELLMLYLAEEVDDDLPLAVSTTRAKQRYLSQMGDFGPYDEKALMQLSFIGFPNLRVDLPGTAATAASSASTAVVEPDGETGIPAADVVVAPAFDRVDTSDGSYDTVAGGGSTTVHFRPMLPKLTFDVTSGAGEARGALMLLSGGATADESSFDPVLVRPTLESREREPEPRFGDVVFPAALAQLRRSGSGDGGRDTLVVVPAQFAATGTNADHDVIGAYRRYGEAGNMTFRVFYSNAPDRVAPTITRVEGVVVGSTVTFLVEASDAGTGSDGTADHVYVNFKDGSGLWRNLKLLPSADGRRFTAGAVISGDEVEFDVHAVDGAGNVGVARNKGLRYLARPPAHVPPEVLVEVRSSQPPVDGWYRDAMVHMEGPAGISFEYSLDLAPFASYTGAFPVTGDGMHRVDWRASNGERGVLLVPIDASGPIVRISTPVDGARYVLRQPVTAAYACADSASATTSCTGSVPDGAAIDTTTVGAKIFSVTATDSTGNETTESVTYHVVYDFDGFFSPIKMGALNEVRAGRGVPLKFRLWDFGRKQQITDTSAVGGTGSFQIDCNTGEPMSPMEGTLSTGQSTLRYDLASQQFVYDWATDPAWVDTCRRFAMALDDNTVHTVNFRFR